VALQVVDELTPAHQPPELVDCRRGKAATPRLVMRARARRAVGPGALSAMRASTSGRSLGIGPNRVPRRTRSPRAISIALRALQVDSSSAAERGQLLQGRRSMIYC